MVPKSWFHNDQSGQVCSVLRSEVTQGP